ncbi:MazG-like family protein [Enterococcus durans]|uniref:MazG-like family protein n=1 Tax=Enterococcus durans TaxID=53345 RepID=UPI00115BB62D|nr:MazG-like family protein [Enterococcus durans]
MDELITKVEQWAKDNGLNQADPKAQFLKVAEEFGEIASAMARSNDELFKDSVGDVIITLIILSMQKGTNVQECLEMAYNEIKGRTGKMVDGVFVKSSDLEESK